jgi:hypothetical protein
LPISDITFCYTSVEDAQCTADAFDVLNDASIDIVIELIGGVTFARTVVLEASTAKST